MRGARIVCLVILLGHCAAATLASEVQWKPGQPSTAQRASWPETQPTAPIAASARTPVATQPAATLGDPVPAATLGDPQPMVGASPGRFAQDRAWAQCGLDHSPAAFGPVSTVSLNAPMEADPPTIVRAQAGPPPASVPPFPDEYAPPAPPGNWFIEGYDQFIGGVKGVFTGNGMRKPLQSDHCFDGFISPVSSPFLFEDPRALTELRPIFMLQTMPSGSIGSGGTMEWTGLQARVALTENISFVINKLGFLWIQPKNSWGDQVGFSELWLGPKITFLRNESRGTVMAGGVTFQIPTGPNDVVQNTGTLSIVPYVSVAQNFGRSSYGSFNAMGTMAYAASVNNERSDYLYAGLHLDYNIANANKFYPLIELNWTYYTSGGNSPFTSGFEGGDLINFGSQNVSGHNNLTLAFGGRYKFSEAVQLGTTFEFPLLGTKDLLDFRWTIDMIFRY